MTPPPTPASQIAISEKPADKNKNLYHWRLRWIRTAHLLWQQKKQAQTKKETENVDSL